jgi:hypothetical protein
MRIRFPLSAFRFRQVALGPQKRARHQQRRLPLNAERRNILFDDARRRHVPLDERGVGGAAAEGLQAQRAGAGEQVDRVPPRGRDAHQVEDRLPQPVLHRPGHQIVAGAKGFVPQPPAAKLPAHNLDLRGLDERIGRATLRLRHDETTFLTAPGEHTENGRNCHVEVRRDVRPQVTLSGPLGGPRGDMAPCRPTLPRRGGICYLGPFHAALFSPRN